MNSIASAASAGFLTSIALILAIDAQNAFVLKQGIARQHIFWVCMICAASDALLIAAGVAGFGIIASKFPTLPTIMQIGGALFLVIYGLTHFLAAYRGNSQPTAEASATNLWPTIAVALALTWLNPHVYLDTLGLIGAVSTQFETMTLKIGFAISAAFASFSFFFSLGYGAKYLAPILQTASAWRVLDVLIGLLMWILAYGLVFG